MKLKLFNIQFSKISIFHLKKNPLLAANRFYHKLKFHQYSPEKWFSGEPTALRQKDLLGGHHITSSTINGLGFQLALT
jgi:hypothetical protein